MSLSWSLIPAGIKTGQIVFNETQRKKLSKKFKLLLRKKRKIIIYGISGTGKSQFIECLKNSIDIPNRTVTTDKFRYNLDDFPIIFLDTPGHKTRDEERKKALIEIINGKVIGIVNIVSYGYVENLKADIDIDSVFDASGNVKESSLKQNRTLEIERLSEWLNFVNSNSVKWVLNIVNKADLWWDKQNEVNDYYDSGDFNTAFKSINNQINLVNLPYCALIKPYYNNKTSGRFGDIDKHNLHSYLIHQILNLLKD
jgi:hypothetical protein